MANKEKRTLLYIFITVTIVCLLLEVIVITINSLIREGYLISEERNGEAKKKSKICNTEGCVRSARMLLNSINQSVDPCHNFYEFACRGWMKRNPLADETSFSFAKSMMITENDPFKVVKKFLKSSITEELPKHLKMLHTVHATCEKAILGTDENTGHRYLRNVLHSLGGWPVIVGEQWNESNFNIIDTLINITKSGLESSLLFQASIIPRRNNTNENMILLKKPKFFMDNNETYSKANIEENRRKYFNEIYKALEKIEIEKHIIIKEKELEKIFQLEISLFKFSKLESEMDVSIEVIGKWFPQMEWMKYFHEIIDPHMEKIEIIRCSTFIHGLATVLNYTNTRTIANYMFLKVVSQASSHLNKSIENCLFNMSDSYSVALASAYARALSFTNDTLESVTEVASYIRKSTMQNLNNITWMTHDVRNYTLKQVNEIVLNFPFVLEILNDTIMDSYYSNLIFDDDSFFKNELNIRWWRMNLEFRRLRKTNDGKDWTQFLVFNRKGRGTFEHFKNIEITVQMLQHSAFSEHRPNCMNYGAFGFSIGHKFMRLIIPHRNIFGENSSINKWWDLDTYEAYELRKRCLINQYSKFLNPNILYKVNGAVTSMEIFLDYLGLKIAYNAYIEREKYNSLELTLPGIGYTARQIFWMNFANFWSEKYSRYTNGKLEKDLLSTIKLRILGILRNMKEFSADFNCPLGTDMNPVKKCEIY